jgi:hypothetical protein
MRFLTKLLGRIDAATPGVYELGRRERRRVSSLDDFDATAADRNDLLGARTEILFHKLYDAVAHELATVFDVPLEPSEEDCQILSAIAVTAGVSLDDAKMEVDESEVDEIVWRNAARTATLTLFDYLINSIDALRADGDHEPLISLSDVEWVERVVADDRFSQERFAQSSGLVDDEATLALSTAACAITEWERFRTPGEHVRYRGANLFILVDEGAHKLHCVQTDSPTIAYMEAELKQEEDQYFVFAADDSALMPVGSQLYFDRVGEHVRVACGDIEQIAPMDFGLSLTVRGALPTVREHEVAAWDHINVLSFRGPLAGATFAVPKDEVRVIAGNGFLLQGNLEH